MANIFDYLDDDRQPTQAAQPGQPGQAAPFYSNIPGMQGLSPDQQRGAFSMGLLQAAGAIANANRPSAYRQSAGNLLAAGAGGFGMGAVGSANAMQSQQQAQAMMDQKMRLEQVKAEQAQQEAARKQGQYTARQDYLAGLSPEERARAAADPDSYFKELNAGLTGDAANLQLLLGRKPTLQELSELKRAGSSTTTINMPAMQKKFDEVLGGEGAKYVTELGNMASEADKALVNIESMQAVLNDGYTTGALSGITGALAKKAEGIGLPPGSFGLPNATHAQIFEAGKMKNLLSELVAQKGPQTEGDAQRAMATFAQITNTTEANQYILDYARAVNKRKIMQAQFIGNELSNNGGNRIKADEAWRKYIATQPSIVPALRSAKKGQGAAQPQGAKKWIDPYAHLSDEELMRGL